MTDRGADLALLLLAAYRRLVDQAVDELAARGFADITPALHYAMAAIESGADTATELARALSVTKQAVAKTVATLEGRGYVAIETDTTDTRRKRLQVTPRGREVMNEGAAIFDDLRDEWASELGGERLEILEDSLRGFVGDRSIRLNAPGWRGE